MGLFKVFYRSGPPNGSTIVCPVIEKGDIVGYERTRVRQCNTTEHTDLWQVECVLSIEQHGSVFKTRDVVEMLAELQHRSPMQFTSLQLASALFAMDETVDPELTRVRLAVMRVDPPPLRRTDRAVAAQAYPPTRTASTLYQRNPCRVMTDDSAWRASYSARFGCT